MYMRTVTVAAASHFVEKIQNFEILPRAMHARDAVLVRPLHARAKRTRADRRESAWEESLPPSPERILSALP